jgi:choline dehydrogenase-like flavoprotein
MRQFTPSTEVDFVVIGSGAAGGIMAKQLSSAGFSVVVLEQGGWGKYGHEQDYTKDEWLNDNPSPEDRLMSDPGGRQPNTFRRTEKDKAVQGSHSYGCVVGGGTVTYGGSSWRHLPYEFREVSHDPTIPSGTGMADWPIRAKSWSRITSGRVEMGISGLRVDSPFFAPMSKPYPVAPLPLKSSGALFEVAAKKLGLVSVPSPMAIISEPYQGAPPA